MKRGVVGFVLFLFLLISVIWHLPAQWVERQLPNASALPATLITGRWHQGQAVVIEPQQQFPRIKLAWALQGVSWLWGQPEVKLVLQDFTHSSQTVSLVGRWDAWTQQVQVSSLKAKVTLPTLAKWAAVVSSSQSSPQLSMLSSVQGSLRWQALQMQIKMNAHPWPQQLSGQGQLLNLNAMGIEVPKLAVTLSQKAEPIQINLKGGGKGWQLTGSATLQPNHHYQLHLEVNAQPGHPLPDWTAMMMRQVTAQKAVLQTQGRW